METITKKTLKVVRHAFVQKGTGITVRGLVVLLDANNRSPIEVGLYKELRGIGSIQFLITTLWGSKMFLWPLAIRRLQEAGYRLQYSSGRDYDETEGY